MGRLNRTCLHFIVSSALAATCVAQGGRTQPPKREPAPRRLPGVSVIVPEGRVEGAPPEFSKIGQATVEFNPRLNLTTVTVMLQDVYRRREATANLEFDVMFKGREPVRQDEVHWMFWSDWDIFRGDAPLMVEADGKRFSFKPEREASDGGLRMGSMDLATFELLVKSRQARLGIGRVTFLLTEGQREALRDMLKIFGTPAKE